jgi:transposase-like protein
MSKPLLDSSSVDSLVDSGWRARAGERSEPERARHPESTPPSPATTSAAVVPDPQVIPKTAKPKRRKFSASDKRRVLEAVDRATEPGEIGRILRREGIYHSQLSKWRRQRAEGVELGLGEKPRGAKGPSAKSLQQENRKLQRQKARLEQELRRARIIIEFQKKAAALFETATMTEES